MCLFTRLYWLKCEKIVFPITLLNIFQNMRIQIIFIATLGLFVQFNFSKHMCFCISIYISKAYEFVYAHDTRCAPPIVSKSNTLVTFVFQA